LRQVVVDLATHALDLGVNRRRKLGLSGCRGERRFPRQDGERRLEAVREIARLRDRAADRAFPVIEVGVQLVHHRLDLDGIGAGDPRLAAVDPASAARSRPNVESAADLGQPEERQPTAPMKSTCCGDQQGAVREEDAGNDVREREG
jgi:hypothetical protein